jgi:hypothetical protein
MFPECRPNTNLLRFHASWNLKSSLCIAKFKLKISPKKILKHFLKNFLFFYPIFILYYNIPYTNLHTKFRKDPSMFVESRANIKVHRFHAQTASWQPF